MTTQERYESFSADWRFNNALRTAVMDIKYSHLVQGYTVPQALWLTMFRLVRRLPHKLTRDHATVTPDRVSGNSESSEASQDGHQDELKEVWKRSYH